MPSEERLGFIRLSLMLLRNPPDALKALSKESDYMGLIMYGGIASILIGATEYLRLSKVMGCLVELTGEPYGEISRSLIMSEVLPVSLFDLVCLFGYMFLVLTVAYVLNRFLFKREAPFSIILSAAGYLMMYMDFFIVTTLIVALIIPPIFNVSIHPGTYGVIAPLLRDYSSLPQIQQLLGLGYIISRAGYITMTAAILLSLRYISDNTWEEIAVMSLAVLPVYIVLWGWHL